MEPKGRRILIDGTMARGGGGFTYLVNVLPKLAAVAPRDRFRLLLRSPAIAEALPALPNLEVELLPEVALRGRLRFTYRELPRRARDWGADLLFSAGETTPLFAPCPSIASFRNPNICRVMAPDFRWRERPRLATLRALATLSAWTCDRVLFVSEDSAGWMGDALGLPASRRAVVHHGIDPERWAPEPAEPLHPWPYLLSVSSLYRYKNFVPLIEAYALLARRRSDLPDLVIIGDEQHADYARRMEAARDASGAADRIHILGEIPYRQIASYYAGAELFVFPSYRETFGFPLLEAMAMDVPVVAADIPVFRELAADAAFYADPHSAASLAGAMEAALYAVGARETLVKRGRERVKQFTWERTAHRLDALFEAVLAEAAPHPLAVPAAA